jgi:hypothetical protein
VLWGTIILMKSKCLGVAFVIALFAGMSRADSIYQVTGDLTITGPTVGSLANACTPSPCVETLQFSFELGYQLFSFFGGIAYAPYIVPGTLNVTSVGPLDQFAGFSGFLGNEGYNFTSFVNGGADNIDLIEIGGTGLGGFPDSSLPGPPVFPYSLLYQCRSRACIQDFGLPGGPDGTAEATVVPVPEGSQLAMLGICIAGILFAARKYRLA